MQSASPTFTQLVKMQTWYLQPLLSDAQDHAFLIHNTEHLLKVNQNNTFQTMWEFSKRTSYWTINPHTRNMEYLTNKLHIALKISKHGSRCSDLERCFLIDYLSGTKYNDTWEPLSWYKINLKLHTKYTLNGSISKVWVAKITAFPLVVLWIF